MSRIVSLSYCVGEELLNCLEGGVSFSETTEDSGEDFLGRLILWLTLGDILGTLLHNHLLGTPGRQLEWVEAVDHPVIPSFRRL